MIKYRLRFTKTGDTRFISHLDLVRFFTRLFTRAGIPLSYSQGFNPHPKMSIALPLSVGMESECEYMDVTVEIDFPEQELIDRLNAKSTMGIEITAAKKLDENSKKLSDIASADYYLGIVCEKITKGMIGDFLDLDTIEVVKKTKRSEALTNIRKDILSINLESTHVLTTSSMDCVTARVRLSAGSGSNLKPDLLILAMEKYINNFKYEYFTANRIGIYDSNGQPLI